MEITDIYLVYSDINNKTRLEEAETPPFFVHYYDMLTKEGRSKGYKLKSEFGARKDPFAVVYNGESPIKAYYSEDSNDVIGDLLNDLSDESN